MKNELLDSNFETLGAMPVLRPIRIPTGDFDSTWERVKAWWFTSRKYVLVEDYVLEIEDEGMSIVIPAGVTFDGASVPRLLWWIANPMGVLMIPSIVHDFAYEKDKLLLLSDSGVFDDVILMEKGRKYWDQLFLKMSLDINKLKFISWASYFMLRVGGWWMWRKFRKGD